MNQKSYKDLTTQYQANLLKGIVETYNEDELSTLCFTLGVDFENLPANSKEGKVRELILFLARRDRIDELIQLISIERKNRDWNITKNFSQQNNKNLSNSSYVLFGLSLSCFIAFINIFATRFTQGNNYKELITIFSFAIPSLFVLYLILNLRWGYIKEGNISLLLVLSVTIFAIVGFSLIFRWVGEEKTLNNNKSSPSLTYDVYHPIYTPAKR
ncbi:MAG: hypothetical protein KIH69_019195 [Anaerolineae bacterium]|nr:hypothetical protein [Anaerolineae bacterium]